MGRESTAVTGEMLLQHPKNFIRSFLTQPSYGDSGSPLDGRHGPREENLGTRRAKKKTADRQEGFSVRVLMSP